MTVVNGLLTDERRARAAEALFTVSQGAELDEAGLAALRAYDDADLRDGLPLQLAVAELWQREGDRIGGWKIAWTSRGARDRGGPGFRPFGFILASRIVPSGSVLPVGGIASGGLEPEICVTIGSRLSGPEVTIEQARACAESVAPAFEIVSRRLPGGLSLAARIGNGMNNWGLVVGRSLVPGLALDSLGVELRHDGELLGSGTSGAEFLDDPFLSLTRVTRELHANGLALDPGQRVITGSLTPSVQIAGGVYEATFGELGSVTVEFR